MPSGSSSAADAAPIVAYRLRTGPGLRCTRCAPNPAGCDWTPLASEDLPDGGICTACGTDVLIDSSADDLCVCGHARKDHHAVARSCEMSACFCSDPTYPAKPVCTCQTGTWDKFDSPEECEAHGSAMAPPRRPPYAVAYATEDGTQYEVALPGDATVRALDGALVITHGSAVQALIQIRPMEGA